MSPRGCKLGPWPSHVFILGHSLGDDLLSAAGPSSTLQQILNAEQM